MLDAKRTLTVSATLTALQTSLETNYKGAKFMSVVVTVPYETNLDFYGFRVVSRGM